MPFAFSSLLFMHVLRFAIKSSIILLLILDFEFLCIIMSGMSRSRRRQEYFQEHWEEVTVPPIEAASTEPELDHQRQQQQQLNRRNHVGIGNYNDIVLNYESKD